MTESSEDWMKKVYFYQVDIFTRSWFHDISDTQSNDVYPFRSLKIDRSRDVQLLPVPVPPEDSPTDQILLHYACLIAFRDLHEIAQSNDDFKDIAPFVLSDKFEECIRSFLAVEKTAEKRISDRFKKIYRDIKIDSIRDDDKIIELKSRRKEHPERWDQETVPYFNVKKMQELFLEAVDDPISRKAFFLLIHTALLKSYFGDDLDRHQIPGEVIDMAAEAFVRFDDIKPKRGRAKIDPEFKKLVGSCLEQIMKLTGRDKSKSRKDNTLKSSAIDVFVESWNKVSEICQDKDIIELDRIGPSKEGQVLGRLEKLEFRQVEAWFETRAPQKSPK